MQNTYLPAYVPGEYGSVYTPVDATTQALASDLRSHFTDPRYQADVDQYQADSWENEGGSVWPSK